MPSSITWSFPLVGDKSRKGSVDAPIVDLVGLINGHPSIFTTSSCSGRLSVFGERNKSAPEQKTKGGEWVYATHDEPDAATVIEAVTQRLAEGNLGEQELLLGRCFIPSNES